ncbi:S8 family serine peptidase [Alteromonas lipolytica]|uniref:S8 family serine peptidase n=1 Tax=Alteromonas lipolytica TaxID=1856405 RepID=UPI000A3EFEDF|nr:S8 family serine peptidase [Alteromonas lipolytica]GGF57026.1 serine protease [Alteromonas lipolytica]
MKSLSLITSALSLVLLTHTSVAQEEQILPNSVNKPTPSVNRITAKADSQVKGKQTYIVQLNEPAVAQYNGSITGFSATNPKTEPSGLTPGKAAKRKLDTQANHVRAYRKYLQQRQQSVLNDIARITGDTKVKRQFQLAINGMVVELTPAQAVQIRKLSGIKAVTADKKFHLTTDTSPSLIGATAVWAGNTQQSINALGEGTVVAIFDTGINTDHPSFAATGGDGYIHTNPLGSGNYLGDCEVAYPSLCNDKLIGVYSYPQITNDYSDTSIFPPGLPRNGEDYNGHGSHVASTAAGNILYDVPAVGLAYDLEQSDGYAGAFTFDQISGVAPHANIISFQVCLPGENDDQYNGCYGNVAIAAIDDAIATGIVDAINYSISGGEDVWGDTLSEAWLSANNAGIFVAHSAGNDGPDRATSDKYAPWITPVAASTHGRSLDLSKTIGSFSGGTTPPGGISGQSNTGAISAAIVYAGDYANPNDPTGDPAQCLEPYPDGSFNGEIVVCDRGDIARIQKAINVAAGGAGGYVLANVAGDAENLVADEYVIPGIHINAADGERLKTWLASGSDHRATISATAGIRSVNSDQADHIAGFSSRGPNTEISTLLPMITAPGVDIYAAYADEHYGHETTGPAPADYAYLDGTSMASPHVAGAALLLRQLHPDWSADAIRSAIMLTATTTVGINGSSTAANWLDMGAGRMQIDAAADASLIMEETEANYTAANPLRGGDPKSLNLPALVDNNCLIECRWQRTFTATRDGSWSFALDDMDSGLSLTAEPASMTLAAGQSQTVTFTLNTWNALDSDWSFANVLISGNDATALHVPVAVIASNGNFPEAIQQTSSRANDSLLLKDLLAIEITDFTYDVTGLTLATKITGAVTEDSAPNDIYDDLTDGVYSLDIVVTDDAPRLVVEITQSSAPDLDLYIAYDANSDGLFSEDELLDISAGFSWDEYLNIFLPSAGTYRIYVHNYTGSALQQDNFTVEYAVVGSTTDGTLTLDAPSSVALRDPFDLRLLWALDGSLTGDRYYASVTLGASAETPVNLGIIPVDIVRGDNDVGLAVAGNGRVSPGESVTYSVEVAANTTNEDRDYDIEVSLPDGTSVVAGSVSDGGVINGNTISWSITQSVTAGLSGYNLTTPQSDSQCLAPDAGFVDLSGLGYQPLNTKDGNVIATFPVSVNAFGEQWHGITISSNGFIMPSSSPALAYPGVNRMLADGTLSTALFAPLWRDWSFNDEATSGLTVATLAAGSITVIQWRGLQAGEYGADIQMIINHAPDTNEPQIIFTYQNVTTSLSESMAGTVGWQNSSGQSGQTLAFNAATSNTPMGDVETRIQSGTVLCLTPANNIAATGPAALSFALQVDDSSALNGTIPVTLTSRVTNIPGTTEEIAEVNTQAQLHAAPEITINGSASASISLTEFQTAVLPLSVTDANGDSVTLSVSQLSGPAATLLVTGNEVSVTPASVNEGTTVQLEITATDTYGFSDSATVTITVTPNQPPVLNVSAPASVQEGATITVRASATDPEGDDIVYTINGISGAAYSSTAPETDSSTSVTFTVTASDGLNTVTQTVTVTVTDRPSGGGGSLSLVWLAALLLLAGVRRMRCS